MIEIPRFTEKNDEAEIFNMKRNKTLTPSQLPKRYVISERPLMEIFFTKEGEGRKSRFFTLRNK